MASIHKEIRIHARPEKVWDAVRDVGAIHTRLAPGFVVDTRLEADARVVTFANGMVVRELIVDVDDESRREVRAANVLGRLFEVEEAARLVLFLASPHGSSVTGTTVDGTGAIIS